MATKVWTDTWHVGLGTGPDLARWKYVWADLHNSLVACGFVWSSLAAAQQYDYAAAVATPTINTYTAFRIYELNDSLSGSSPIYIKVALGLGSSYGGFLLSQIQFGTSVDDSTGALGGLVTTAIGLGTGWTGNYANSVLVRTSMITRGEGRCAVMFNPNAINYSTMAPRPSIFFALERTTDSLGNYTAGGYTAVGQNSSQGNPLPALVSRSMTANMDTGWQATMMRAPGGYEGVSAGGAIQLLRCYQAAPDLKPLKTMVMYYNASIADTSYFTFVDSKRFLALGAGAAGANLGGMLDTAYPGWCLAVQVDD